MGSLCIVIFITMVYECAFCLGSLESDAPPPSSTQKVSKNRGHQKVNLSEICSTGCGHMFHRSCLDSWFNTNGRKRCPSCLRDVAIRDIRRIYPPRSSESDADTASSSCSEQNEKAICLDVNGVPHLSCVKQECNDLLMLHKMLIEDFTELQKRYADIRDQEKLLIAKNTSLETELTLLRQKHMGGQSNKRSHDGSEADEEKDDPSGKRIRTEVDSQINPSS